jgi:hypothetical protein
VTIGFINNVALDGKFRSDEDRIARGLGYTPGKWPLVPLEGVVVQQTSGLLEVYEYSYAFATAADAADWVRYALTLNAADATKRSAGKIEGFAAYTRVLGPNDGLHETAVSVVGRVGNVAVTLAFQGGATVTTSGVSALIRTALDRIRVACHQSDVQA